MESLGTTPNVSIKQEPICSRILGKDLMFAVQMSFPNMVHTRHLLMDPCVCVVIDVANVAQ